MIGLFNIIRVKIISLKKIEGPVYGVPRKINYTNILIGSSK